MFCFEWSIIYNFKYILGILDQEPGTAMFDSKMQVVWIKCGIHDSWSSLTNKLSLQWIAVSQLQPENKVVQSATQIGNMLKIYGKERNRESVLFRDGV